jgi:CMP-N-acetylneuraminic acid synthetase
MKILAIIPARVGSKRLPNKNIRRLNGKPLIHYPIELAILAEKKGLIIGHIVSTDDEKTASIAKEAGGNISFIRPANLAGDDSKVVDTAIHAVTWWQDNHHEKIDSVLLLQPTSPLTTIEDIEKAIGLYIQHHAKCLISVCKAQHFISNALYQADGINLKQIFINENQSGAGQGLQQLYLRNGGIYISRCSLLFEKKVFIDENPLFYEMPRLRSVAIDDMFDWILAEALIQY